MIKLNHSYTILFTSTVAGVGTAADSTPTAVLWRNGSASGVSVTVSTTAQTGLYKAVFTTDAGWAIDDLLELYGVATIAGTSGYLAKLWSSTEIGAVALDPAVTTKIDSILEDTGTTLPAQISSISSGGGDATLANQELILEELTALATTQLAAVEVNAGTISGFPETLTIGDSYSVDTGQIRINITDSTSGDPIGNLGTLEFVDADVTFIAFRPNDSARIIGTCEYVREPSSGTLTASYVLVTLLTSETAKGKAEYTYEGRLKFVWQGPSSSDETDEEQKTYKTTPFKFIANP